MKKIRVLFLSKPYVSSSYRQKLRIMAQDPQFEIGLITPFNWAGQDFEKSDEDNFWIRNLPIVLNGRNHFHFYRGLDRAIGEFQPDIFNIEEEHYSIVTAQCIYLAKKHGAQSCFYTWQNIFKIYPRPFSWIERYVFRNVSLGVAGNAEAVDVLRKKGFNKSAPIIPQMGADSHAIQLVQESGNKATELNTLLPADAFVIAFAGRLVEEKGIQDLIRAVALLGETKIYGVILGSGPYQDELKKLVESLKLEQNILFLGSKKSTDIYRYLAQIHVLALPSLTRSNWKEQFGRILVEAMLSGAVPLGSSSGEIPRVIKNAGLIFPEGNVRYLADRILRLFKDRHLLKKLAEKGKKRALKNFTNEVIAMKTSQALLAVMQNRKTT